MVITGSLFRGYDDRPLQEIRDLNTFVEIIVMVEKAKSCPLRLLDIRAVAGEQFAV